MYNWLGKREDEQNLTDMQTWQSRCKGCLKKIVFWGFFYLGAIELVNFLTNRFQPKRDSTGSPLLPFVCKRRSRNIQILVYHRVNNESDPFFAGTPIHVFARQMDYLASNFHICSLEGAVERIKENEVPENAIVITFDDGYKDNYLNAFPILKQFSIPATVFVATDAIGSGRVLWHDRVFAAFRETRQSFLEGFGYSPKRYALRTLAEKLCAQRAVLQFLWSLDNPERVFWVDRLREELHVVDRNGTPDAMLTWDEIKTMHQNGVAFGSHTVTHPILSRLTPEQAREEIHNSKRTIEEKLGTPIRTFAYPVGRKKDFNETTKDILKELGYICALTTVFGANEQNQDLFELRRGGPWEADLPTFATKLSWYKFRS